jgi:ABC-type antimicrobial peptide transport system permease subunit
MTLALANILQRKVRSLISILAVAIGVTLLLVLVGMTRGSINEVASRIQNVGGDMIVQQAGAALLLYLPHYLRDIFSQKGLAPGELHGDRLESAVYRSDLRGREVPLILYYPAFVAVPAVGVA